MDIETCAAVCTYLLVGAYTLPLIASALLSIPAALVGFLGRTPARREAARKVLASLSATIRHLTKPIPELVKWVARAMDKR